MKIQIEHMATNCATDTAFYNIISNGELIGYAVDYNDELAGNYGAAYAILKGKFRGAQYACKLTSLYDILQYLLLEIDQVEPDSEITIDGFKIEPLE